MRAYFLIFALVLLPHLVLSSPGHPSPSYINKVFARRTRNSPKYVGSTPRQVRFSRYIQEPDLQQELQQQKLQQSNVLDDVDLEQEIEQQQQQPQQQQMIDYGDIKSTTVSSQPTKSSNGNGYQTQTPFYAQETSTARPVQQVQQQMKDEEEELSQISQPLSQQQQTTSEFEQDADLSQNYMPTKELLSNGYSPAKQMKQRLSPSQNGYAPSNGYGNGHSNGNGGGHSGGNGGGNGGSYAGGSAGAGGSGFGGSVGGSAGGSAHSEALADFGFANEEDNSLGSGGGSGSMEENIRGEPGKDYPVLASVPVTGFKCSAHSFPGYYGDVEAQCQVFHVCQEDGRHHDFLCPNGTIFSQRHFVCVWWYEFECATTEQFYDLNAELFKETEVRGGGNGGGNGGSGSSGQLVGGSVPSSVTGGSVPSVNGNGGGLGYGGELGTGGAMSGKLNSPKENFNKMYMAQIDEFSGVTTSSPSYYGGGNGGSGSNGKTMQRKATNGNGNGFKGVSQQKQQPVQQYEQQSVDSVTPSSLDSGYETTPYNLDEALGEEIHSPTPILEALSLTTNLPKMQSIKSYNGNGNNGYASTKSNGNGAMKGNGNGNYYASTKSMPDFGFGGELSFTSPKPSYGNGGAKSKTNGKTSPKTMMLSQVTEAPMLPVKGGATKSTKSMYGGNGNGNGNGNGFKNLKSPASNGFKSYNPSPSSYGGLKH